MLYLYDKAISDDLVRSFNPNAVEDPLVKVFDPEGIPDLIAAIKEDNMTFPVASLYREPDVSVDTTRTNFTRLHFGQVTVLDPATNELYYEKVIPIKLNYKITVLATNTADIDELVRELLFKYTQQYFMTIKLPYECSRLVRFGVLIDPDSSIERSSGSYEYLKEGKLHQAIIPIKCEGAVLVSYRSAKLKRTELEVQPLDPQ